MKWLIRIFGLLALCAYPFIVVFDRYKFADLLSPGISGWGQSAAFVWKVWRENYWDIGRVWDCGDAP